MFAVAKTRRQSRQQISETRSLPAPVGGWNVRDSLALMKETEAAILDNWFPTTTDLQLRKGYSNWATGLSGTTETIMAYNSPAGTRKLFAVTSAGDLYDVTSSGAVGAALISGLTNGRWQYVAYGTAAGNFLLACNGTDPMLRYNGTNWITILGSTAGVALAAGGIVGNGTVATVTATGHKLQTGNTVTITGCSGGSAALNVGPVAITRTGANTFTYPSAYVGTSTGAPAYTISASEVITGVDPATILSVNSFKQRVWLVPRTGLSVWYLAASAISGAATEFPLSSYYIQGGTITTMATWTIDVGIGIDDNAVFISSEGEVLVYKGTDPSSPTTFALQGLFRMGNPIGTRCQIKYLGDVYVITDQGVMPMSQAILTAQVTIKADLTNKIQPAVATAIQSTRTTFGWQLLPYPAQNMLIVNAPGSPTVQFVMNTITGAWCRFTGWNASCWEAQGNNIYFGSTGIVALAWSGTTDAGSSIVADALPAFNYFGNRGKLKSFKAARPILLTDGSPSLLGTINIDYDTTAPSGSLSYIAPSTGMVWGSMTWGSMVWGGVLSLSKNWQYAGGVGYCGAFRFKAQNNGANVRWEAIDYVIEAGGVIA